MKQRAVWSCWSACCGVLGRPECPHIGATCVLASRSTITPSQRVVTVLETRGASGEYRSTMLERQKHIDISVEPLDEYLVIQPSNDETETRAGLILPASAAASVAVRTGIVTAIGSDVTGVDVGDKVLYPREAGFEVRLGGIEVKVLKREELIARIHD